METCEHSHTGRYQRPRYELADIFNRYGDNYRAEHWLSPLQKKVMTAIQLCRTSFFGGHKEECDTCGYERNAYNSCCNRHCPKCQTGVMVEWVKNRLAELLPIPYYHSVMTLPHLLNVLTYCNKRIVYDIFFRASANTLQTFARDPKWLGADIGIIGILHTWNQVLGYHVHLHLIIPAGGIAIDGSQWKTLPYRKKFLFPVYAISMVMAAKFRDLLQEAYDKGKLKFPGKLAELAEHAAFTNFLQQVARAEWYNYTQKPFAGPAEVVKYLGRYTHRVAISNHRLSAIDNGAIKFWVRDRNDKSKKVPHTLPAPTFIGRFMQHVLPFRFKKIRYFGYLASGHKKEKLELANKLLNAFSDRYKEQALEKWLGWYDKAAFKKCPKCKIGNMITKEELPRYNFSTGENYYDSS